MGYRHPCYRRRIWPYLHVTRILLFSDHTKAVLRADGAFKVYECDVFCNAPRRPVPDTLLEAENITACLVERLSVDFSLLLRRSGLCVCYKGNLYMYRGTGNASEAMTGSLYYLPAVSLECLLSDARGNWPPARSRGVLSVSESPGWAVLLSMRLLRQGRNRSVRINNPYR